VIPAEFDLLVKKNSNDNTRSCPAQSLTDDLIMLKLAI